MRGTGKVMVNTLPGNALWVVRLGNRGNPNLPDHTLYLRIDIGEKSLDIRLDKAKACEFNPETVM